MKHILMIVGSQRGASFNKQLAKVIEEKIGDRARVSYLDYSQVPFLNLDIEYPTPAPVAEVRRQVKEADGIWIVTPQHNSSYPGLLKNLLDWLSRPMEQNNPAMGTAIRGKKVTVSGAAGKTAAKESRLKLGELLGLLRTQQMTEYEVGISVNVDAFKTNQVVLTSEQLEAIQQQVEGFLEFIKE